LAGIQFPIRPAQCLCGNIEVIRSCHSGEDNAVPGRVAVVVVVVVPCGVGFVFGLGTNRWYNLQKSEYRRSITWILGADDDDDDGGTGVVVVVVMKLLF
jgi:hypothetical protein